MIYFKHVASAILCCFASVSSLFAAEPSDRELCIMSLGFLPPYVDEAVEKGLTDAGFEVRMIKMTEGVNACAHCMVYMFKINEKEDVLEGIFFQTFRNGEEEFEGFGVAHPDGDMRTAEIRAYAKEFGERMLDEM